MKDFPLEMIHGSGVRVLLDNTRLLVEFTQATTEEEAGALVRRLGFELEKSEGSIAGPLRTAAELINHTPNRLWLHTLQGVPVPQDLYERLREMPAPRVRWIGPVYHPGNMRDRGGHFCPLPNVLVIRAQGEAGAPGDPLRQIAEKYGLEEDGARGKYLVGFRIFLIADPNRANAYQLRDAITRDFPETAREIAFENMPMVRDQTVIPSDPLYPQQWGMARINAGGAGTTGWNLSTGSSTVVVAVMDYGFDLTHPDLAYVAGVKLDDMTTLTSATSGTDPHGTGLPHV